MKTKKHKKESEEIKPIEIHDEIDVHTECVEKYEDLKKQYLRALADYKNLEHRVEQERYRMRDAAKREVIEQMLPVLDNLDQAEVFNDDPGLKMISNSFQQSLKNLGVEELQLLGSEYDPATSEAIEAVVGEKDNIVVGVVQRAYKMHGSLIRHGKVKVSKIAEN